ncbi:hypothetical protein Si133o_00994 [Streptococcus infantarius subsp. infantarius]|nr:hypothetical protein [Streptococcus infantarius subsp. infantarius]
MANELWKPVKGFEGVYEVSSEGRVRSVERRDARGQLRKSKIMSVKKIQNTKKVTFFRDGKSKTFTLKKLVAGAFVDGNPDNICAENLKWQKKALKKHNIYRFEDNKTGEVFEGSISDCSNAWDLTKSALLNHVNRGRVTKTLVGVAGLRTFTDIETGEKFHGTKCQAIKHFGLNWYKFYDRVESGLIQMFPPDDESTNNEDKISDPETKRLLNQYYLKKINELVNGEDDYDKEF